MPFGYSTPISVPVGALAGIVGGHYVEKIAKASGCSEVVCRVAAGAGGFISTAVAAGAVNSAVGDVGVGYATTVAQSAVTGVAQTALGSSSVRALALKGVVNLARHAL